MSGTYTEYAEAVKRAVERGQMKRAAGIYAEFMETREKIDELGTRSRIYNRDLEILSNLIVKSSKYDDYLVDIFKPLEKYNVIFVPRPYNNNDELLYKAIRLVKGWKHVEIKDVSTILSENKDTIREFGVPPDVFLHSLNSEIYIKARKEVVSSTDIGIKGGLSNTIGKFIASITKRNENKAKYIYHITPELAKTATEHILTEKVEKPTILIPHESELLVLGTETLVEASKHNRNLVTVLWLPHKPSKEHVKLLERHEVGTSMMIKSDNMKGAIIEMYKKIGEELSESKDPQRHFLGKTIDRHAHTGLLQYVVDKFTDKLIDPVMVIDATNRFIAEIHTQELDPYEILGDIARRNPILVAVTSAGKPLRIISSEEYREMIDKMIDDITRKIISEYYGEDGKRRLYETLKLIDDKKGLREALSRTTNPKSDSTPLISEILVKLGVLSKEPEKEETYKGISEIYDYLVDRYLKITLVFYKPVEVTLPKDTPDDIEQTTSNEKPKIEDILEKHVVLNTYPNNKKAIQY